MASKAIAHPHGHILIDNRHRLHFAMASLAENPGVHMGPVIEIYMVGQRVNSFPLQRFAGIKYSLEPYDLRPVNFCNPMAVHAFFHRRNSRHTGFEHSGVAILARSMKRARVKLMGKGDWLIRFVSADKPVGLRKPADTQYSHEHGCGACRQKET